MSRPAGEAGLVVPRGEMAWGVTLGGKAEAGAGGAGLAGGAGSPGVGLLQRKVKGSKSSPRSPSRQRGGLKSSSSPSSSHAEVRCDGDPESAPSPAAEDSEDEEEDSEDEEEDEDRLSQEPAGAGPTGNASLLEWGRRSLCSLWRPGGVESVRPSLSTGCTGPQEAGGRTGRGTSPETATVAVKLGSAVQFHGEGDHEEDTFGPTHKGPVATPHAIHMWLTSRQDGASAPGYVESSTPGVRGGHSGSEESPEPGLGVVDKQPPKRPEGRTQRRCGL
ncbi:hypothetical protein P7K49_034163 [Saguinus oedipus]|uniref:Uncharacterized protein n=1 Tax=Saguinus oedipus TaxID=9490 RepID=A0ABQ9TTY3_SAGOE|nr:hypothetical protein P7K49_034163 [Saguinus oedipus]